MSKLRRYNGDPYMNQKIPASIIITDIILFALCMVILYCTVIVGFAA